MTSHIFVITACTLAQLTAISQAEITSQSCLTEFEDCMATENEIVLLQTSLHLGHLGVGIGSNYDGMDARDTPHQSEMKQSMNASVVELDATKIAWLHIPKAGTSFSNILATWACPSLADDALIEYDSSTSGFHLETFVMDFVDTHRSECKSGFRLCDGHFPVVESEICYAEYYEDPTQCKCSHMNLEDHRSSFFAMFRQPEQRTLSGFNHWYHDYDLLPEFDLANPPTPLQYAQRLEGCAVRMLTGYPCQSAKVIRQQDLELAIHRLDHEFAFVGITEEWDLTVCLFHAMFGGDIHYREFINMRPGTKRTQDQYDTAVLNGFVDAWDGKIYEHAKRIFWNNVRHFGVTRESCEMRVREVYSGQ